MYDRVIDFDDPAQKGVTLDAVRRLTGKQRIQIVAYRPRRTDRQNRFYWPNFVEPFADWMSREWQEPVLPYHAHEFLKARFLKRQLINKQTGERFVRVESTRQLTTTEFNEYLDNVANFLAVNCGFPVEEPRSYHERDKAKAS